MIEIDDFDRTQCGSDCAFLDGNECLLFNTPLNDMELPSDQAWQDDQ